jgi:putative transposase
MNYRRCIIPGGTYFFTVVTYSRQQLFDNPANIATLREAFRYVLDRHPFEIDACVILPDHIHSIWTLPENDRDYPTRWRLLKNRFTYQLASKPQNGPSSSRKMKHEQAIWQRRYWEHLIRDEDDFRMHVEYIHYNPVKHGITNAPISWPYSSFHRYVKSGIYPADWATIGNDPLVVGE